VISVHKYEIEIDDVKRLLVMIRDHSYTVKYEELIRKYQEIHIRASMRQKRVSVMLKEQN
jgi:hypothetical protein